MKTIDVRCDSCEKELNEDRGMNEYRLVLYAETLPSGSNIRLSVMTYPPLDRTYHFCGLGCLDAWRSEPV